MWYCIELDFFLKFIAAKISKNSVENGSVRDLGICIFSVSLVPVFETFMQK